MLMSEIKLSNDDVQKMMGNCLNAWENVDRVEIVMKGSEFEGVDINNVKSSLKIAKANIEEIHTTLFLIEDDKY